MKFLIRIFFYLFLLLPGLLFAQGKYDLWLKNEGFYLLTPQEKDKFRGMSDEQKELYIRDLWASLDTNPITPENEYQIEYMKRYEYAKRALWDSIGSRQNISASW